MENLSAVKQLEANFITKKTALTTLKIVFDLFKASLLTSLIFCCSLFVIGYMQNFYLIQLVSDLVNSLGFSRKSVGEFIVGWSIIAIPNAFCGLTIGKYVSLHHQLLIRRF